MFPFQKVMLLTHVKELIQQNYDKLVVLWPDAPVGIYSDGLGQKESRQQITLGGTCPVWRKPESLGM